MQGPYSKGYVGTVALLRDYPEWRGVVLAALEEAVAIQGDRFAGAWVLERARKHGVRWIPNLRKLVAYGVLEKEGDSTRGGRRSYYAMSDTEGVERALREVGVSTRRDPYAAHEITDAGIARRSTVRVPLYANLASCGNPSESDAHVDDYVEIDSRMIQRGYQYYLVRADGDSMDLAGINNGDLVLVRVQNHADIGQKVIACLADGVTIKELQRSSEFTMLVPRSSNSEHKPIVLRDGVEIQGVVVATIPNFS